MRSADAYPGVTAVLADGCGWHEGGATEGQEIALVLASIVAYLRGCEAAGIAPSIAMPKIGASLAVDADQFTQ